MSKHTKGPWKVTRYTNSNKYHVHPVVAGPILFETVDVDSEGMANAQLIASAPELLAVLKQVVAHCTDDDSGMEFDWEQFQHVVNAAVEIVKKAEGRS